MSDIYQVQQILSRSKGKKEKDQAFRVTCLRVMKAVGGYSEFCSLTIPEYFEIVRCLNDESELEHKSYERQMKQARRGR